MIGAIVKPWRDVYWLWIEGGREDDDGGRLTIVSTEDGSRLRVIASNGGGWDHVSVSLENRCPTWGEMEQVKRELFRDNETAFQLHVPPSDHINYHPFCLHLWRPQTGAIPRPPANMIV
jgi:hypothetical protein